MWLEITLGAPDPRRISEEIEPGDLLGPTLAVTARGELVGEDAELLGAAHVDREQEGIGAFARRRDAGGAAAPDVLGERGGPALHVVDRGGRAVGADADMILAAHVDGMFDMRDQDRKSTRLNSSH